MPFLNIFYFIVFYLHRVVFQNRKPSENLCVYVSSKRAAILQQGYHRFTVCINYKHKLFRLNYNCKRSIFQKWWLVNHISAISTLLTEADHIPKQSKRSQTVKFMLILFLMYHNEQETYLMKYFQRSIFNYHLQST